MRIEPTETHLNAGRKLRLRPQLTLFLILIAAEAHSLAQEKTSDTVQERYSGVSFPVRLTPPGGSASHRLTGTAIRVKTIFRVKVYAFGVYVDQDGAQSSLARFEGMPASVLERDENFYGRILEMKFAMTLRLVMTRDVGGKDVASSFYGALRPRVRRAAAEMNLPGGEMALEQFRSYFDLDRVARGTEIVFSCGPDGRVGTSVDGRSRPAIQSPALCWALFDVYLGDNPVSADGKKSVIAGFPDLLSQGGKRE